MSDSDSDALNEKVRRTKRKFVVKFQIEDTSSDDSDVAGPSNRVRRNQKKLAVIDTSDESDFGGYPNQNNAANRPAIDNAIEKCPISANAAGVSPTLSDNANSSDSDSSGDGTEKCPICLHSFRDQEVGAPNVCEHSYCAPCIEEWSNNVQTCPIDRKPFTTIRIRLRYTDAAFVREIVVNAKQIEPEPTEADFTNCEICGRNDHEESMLLCDGCDAGYHMECLDPPLIEIPEGSWYCDNCFDSDASEDDVDITQLIAELDDLPVPATRLRVRREIAPRITRTRQSERIRTTILNRRQGGHSDDAAVLDLTMPGSSRGRQSVTTTTTRTTISTRTTTTTTRQSRVVRGRVRKSRRRRKVRNRRRKTYVVEYDVDDCNHKFGIKTAKRVIKRRRKTRKSHKKSCARRRIGRNISEASEGVSNVPDTIREQYPKLHLFGNKNALEYFSDEEENDAGIGSLNDSFDAGDGLIVMARSQPSIGGRNLMRRKNIVVRAPAPAEPDLLSNIMDSMNRWHSMSRPKTIEKIKINSDGSFESTTPAETTVSPTSPNSDIQSAPMYPRNGATGNGNRSFNNSNGFRGGNSNRNFGYFSNFSGGNRNSGQFSFQPFQRGGNDGNRSGFGGNFTPNRNPFQRQRAANRNRLTDSNRNQAQGLYDGEDVGPLQNDAPIQSENDVNTEPEPAIKEAQPDDISNDDDKNSTSNQNSNEAHADNVEVYNPNAESLPSISNTDVSNDPAALGQSLKSNDDHTDTDDADDQDFEYSEVSMQVAKDSKDSPEKSNSAEQPPEQQSSSFADHDEDLVQLDDDENFANETADGISEKQVNTEEKTPEIESSKQPAVAESNLDKSMKEDSTDEISASEEDERSYTPLNDRAERSDVEKNENDKPSTSGEKNDTVKTGIEGMDTEMISEDENENILHEGTISKKIKADKENNNRKNEADESFKKVSKSTKDRNYRDKKEKSDGKRRNRRSRSRTKSSSRSASRGRGHRNSRKDKSFRRKEAEKRRHEIQRYDVRTVIAERQPRTFKDKYGRDTSRPPRSASVSPRRDRKSFSRSPSLVYTPRRRSVSRRSPSRTRRRSPSIRRYRRSVSHRRRSPHRNIAPSNGSKSFSRDRFLNGRSRSRSRSVTPKPTHRYHLHKSRSRSGSIDRRSKRKPIDKKVSKNRSKRKSDSRRVSPFHHSPNRLSRSRSWNDRGSWNRSLSDIPNEDIPSWTPPIAHVPENFTVILKNKDSKRKRDKKRKTERRKTEITQKREKRRRTDKQDSPAVPSKEVFASGDNILVSVSFNKDKSQQQHQQHQQQQQQTTIVTLPPTKEQILNKRQSERESIRRSRRTNRDSTRKHRKVDIKPVAIIDLDNSPFKEVTPSPRAVIILSDSDHENDKSKKSQSLNYSVVSNATDSIANDESDDRGTNIHVNSPPQSPGESATFELPMGPKTPPEPSHLVKFSISTNTKTKVRTVMNPLHDHNDDDDDDDDDDDEDDDDRDDGDDVRSMENKDSNIENAVATGDKAQNIVQNQQKVGPNTPPGPCSPDVYDPFEPTKSPSQSPIDSINDPVENEPQKSADDNSKSTKPVDLSMALINSKASIDAAATMLSNTLGVETKENDSPNDDANVSPFKDKPIDERDVGTSKSAGIHLYSNIILTSSKDGASRLQTQSNQSRSSALTIQNLSSVNATATSSKQSPLKFVAGSIISKLPLPKIIKPHRLNGNDNDNMDIESPYSPGSSDYEDLFEPPKNSPLTQSQGTGNHGKKYSSRPNAKASAAGTSSSAPKAADVFDDLFGMSPSNKHKASKKRAGKHNSSIKVTKHSAQPGTYSKLNEEQLRILSDDVPGSAVELQAQDKFLRKLNRQERVIEEVKLVLKPHYNKKHITKDEYKEIMRRAVPKICHNRTGEINPKRIKKLIEAYVAKFRQKRKMHQTNNLVIK